MIQTSKEKSIPLKKVEDVVCCVIDYGSFISLAEKLGETMKKVYYHSPYEEEFQDIRQCVKGTGIDGVERLDDFLDPDVFDEIDLFVFPDIGFQGLQKHLRALGKAVWGQMGASELELDRDFFLQTVESVGLPTIPYERIEGMTKLKEYLEDETDKWVKVDRYRRNMETWHHIDYANSERRLDSLNVTFGGAKETPVFIVQDTIKTDMEIGYDGWCIDGQFPSKSFQGYEKKNALYIGAVLNKEDLPEEITQINDAMSPVLKEYGYRNWWGTEIRVSEGENYFIDPTPRMPGLSGEQQLETCTNLANVLWNGANGILIEPEFKWKIACLAELHFCGQSSDTAVIHEWKTLDIPESVRRWVKLYHYCKIDDIYHISPSDSDTIGMVIGVGDTIEECLNNLKEHLDELSELPVYTELEGFIDLLKEIREAEDNGIKFADEIPDDEIVLELLKG